MLKGLFSMILLGCAIVFFYFFGIPGLLGLLLIPVLLYAGYYLVLALFVIGKTFLMIGFGLFAILTFAIIFLRVAMLF